MHVTHLPAGQERSTRGGLTRRAVRESCPEHCRTGLSHTSRWKTKCRAASAWGSKVWIRLWRPWQFLPQKRWPSARACVRGYTVGKSSDLKRALLSEDFLQPGVIGKQLWVAVAQVWPRPRPASVLCICLLKTCWPRRDDLLLLTKLLDTRKPLPDLA